MFKFIKQEPQVVATVDGITSKFNEMVEQLRQLEADLTAKADDNQTAIDELFVQIDALRIQQMAHVQEAKRSVNVRNKIAALLS